MRILHLTAGTGSFYCGTCIRDNALVYALQQLGHDAELVPLYMPIVAEGTACSAAMPVMMGGISCYLQQEVPLFRYAPWWVDSLLAARPLLRLASTQAGKTRPEDTGPMTVSMLRGEDGFQANEVARLVEWIRKTRHPDVIVLSNSLLSGLAGPLQRALGVPVVCTLQGELHFVNDMGEPWTSEAWSLLADALTDCAGLLAVSGFAADTMAWRTALDRASIRVVHNGIDLEGYAPTDDPEGPPVVGFLARMYGKKGLGSLATIFRALRERGHEVELVVAGTLNAGDERDVDAFRDELTRHGLLPHVRFRPNLSPEDKREVLRSFSVMCVPSEKDETFGLYHLEALASEVPVVAPHRGAVPEVLERTGGAMLFDPDDLGTAVDAIEHLLRDRARRRELGREGREGVTEAFTARHMAERTVVALEDIVAGWRQLPAVAS